MMRGGLSLLLLSALLGCGGPRVKEPQALIDHSAWRLLEPSEDPFIAEKPAGAECRTEAHGPELLGGEMTLGIDTQDCGYISVAQPALHEIKTGDVLHLRLWHFELTSLQPSQSVAAIAVDGQVIFERSIPIPAESGLESPYWEATLDTPKGAQIVFHLRNHGTNSYSLIELTRGGEVPKTLSFN